MTQPEGFVDPKYPNRVCKLQGSIYGLNQASRSWKFFFFFLMRLLKSLAL